MKRREQKVVLRELNHRLNPLILPVFVKSSVLQEGSDSLVRRLQRKDRAALADAYDLLHVSARTLARRLLGDDVAAEDLVQEVFVALPRAIENFKEQSQLKTFVLSMVVNYAKHHIRGAMRRRALAEKVGRGLDATAAVGGESDIARRELARLLTRALDGLSLEHRTAFVLMELDDRTSSEAAQMAGVPEATMRTRLFHAKRKLRDQLEEWGVR